MPSSYPNAVDSFTVPSAPTSTPLASGGDSSRNHTESHRDLGDAIIATQTHAAKKSYVDAELNKKATLSGGVVPVNTGGTGASTAAQARTNLGIPNIYVQASAPTGSIPEGSLWFQVI